MYFEGNSKTCEHPDSYDLDSQEIGSMCIDARAGRIFICPGSHKLTLIKQSTGNNIATGHDKYIEAVVEHIREQELEIRAPQLDQGDVLLWNSLTHQRLSRPRRLRSLALIDHLSRHPADHEVLQSHARRRPCRSTDVRGVQIHRPKDLSKRLNRFIQSQKPRFCSCSICSRISRSERP